MMVKMVSVSIITRNRANLLQKCLFSLTRQTETPFEVLVIDNASTDKTKKVALSFQKKLPLKYFHQARIGIPYARNRALKEARGEILAFTDDDCEVSRNWIEQIVKAHQRYPEAAAIQGKSYSLPKKGILSSLSEFYHHLWFTQNQREKNELLVLDTKNTSFKREVLIRHGLTFDEWFTRGSDVNLARQLLEKQEKIKFSPHIRVSFWARPTLLSFLEQRYQIGKAQARLSFKWAGNERVLPIKKGAPHRSTAFIIKRIFARGQTSKLPALLFINLLNKYVMHLGRIVERVNLTYQILGYPLKGNVAIKKVTLSKRNSPTINVVICTRNRSENLKRCLNSLANQTIRPDSVIIVDNNSSDATPQVAQAFKEKLPLTYLFEPKPGVARARNLALRKLREGIVAFLDDDCEASKNWVAELLLAYTQNPTISSVQGRVLSLPQKNLLSLLTQYLRDLWYGKNITSSGQILIADTKNFSVRREAIRKYHLRFKEEYFSHLNCGEDVDFGKQIISHGGSILYYGGATVFHSEITSLFQFLNRRRQKGHAYPILKSLWPNYHQGENEIGFHLGSIIQLVRHPLLEKRTYLLPQLLFLFFLERIFFQLGRFTGEIFLKKSTFSQRDDFQVSKRKDKTITVAIITRNRASSLSFCLNSLAKQAILPFEILVINNMSEDKTREVCFTFKDILPLCYKLERKVGIPFARNRALKEARGEILAFLDDDCQTSPYWVKNMLEAHQKYPQAAVVQGRSGSLPTNNIFSIIARFNRQTVIRNNMLGNRNLYWDWVAEKLNDDFEILNLDTKNASIKLDRIRKLNLKFNEKLKRGSDSDFGKQLLSEGEHIIFYPKAFVFHWERAGLADFLKQSFYQGKTLKYLSTKWPSEYSSLAKPKKIIQKTAAFAYYCLKRRHFIKFPLLVGMHFLYQLSFNIGRESYDERTLYYND